jgi:hypothetical protein
MLTPPMVVKVRNLLDSVIKRHYAALDHLYDAKPEAETK